MAPEPPFLNADLCAACGGQCCQKYAGSYVPGDFLPAAITADFILGLLHTGWFAIDWWEGDATGGSLSRTCYLRPRHVGEVAVCGSYGGVCVRWSASAGCALAPGERPFQCRMLVPSRDNGNFTCTTRPGDNATKRDCAVAWYAWQPVLEEAIERFPQDFPAIAQK